jgi:putative NIF3 family GTP cyclohydrolase 1 type 2
MLLGECQHHHVLLARQLGLALLEAGHHATERLIIPYFVTYLKGRFPDLAVIAHEVPADRFLVAGQEEGE